VDELLCAALGYAELGWPVFPCVTPAKVPLTAHGFKDASTDPDVIRSWWARSPRANVAVATGAPGPDVIDVDTKDGRAGLELFDRARRAGLLRGAAAIVRTPSGGLHVWFNGTDQTGGAVGGRDKPLELKARGGYVLLPPSYVINDELGYAGHYELVERRDGAAGTVDFAAIRVLIDPPRRERASAQNAGATDLATLAGWLLGQPQGNRNRGLFWATCTALESGCIDLAPLFDAALAIGLSEVETGRTIASARRRIGVAR
jgi:bifunctional DNA primase/polymerase-like protein